MLFKIEDASNTDNICDYHSGNFANSYHVLLRLSGYKEIKCYLYIGHGN